MTILRVERPWLPTTQGTNTLPKASAMRSRPHAITSVSSLIACWVVRSLVFASSSWMVPVIMSPPSITTMPGYSALALPMWLKHRSMVVSTSVRTLALATSLLNSLTPPTSSLRTTSPQCQSDQMVQGVPRLPLLIRRGVSQVGFHLKRLDIPLEPAVLLPQLLDLGRDLGLGRDTQAHSGVPMPAQSRGFHAAGA